MLPYIKYNLLPVKNEFCSILNVYELYFYLRNLLSVLTLLRANLRVRCYIKTIIHELTLSTNLDHATI